FLLSQHFLVGFEELLVFRLGHVCFLEDLLGDLLLEILKLKLAGFLLEAWVGRRAFLRDGVGIARGAIGLPLTGGPGAGSIAGLGDVRRLLLRTGHGAVWFPFLLPIGVRLTFWCRLLLVLIRLRWCVRLAGLLRVLAGFGIRFLAPSPSLLTSLVGGPS